MAAENKPIDLEMLDSTFGKDGREEILTTFINHSGELFPRMESAFDERNLEVVLDIAHQIKGMCASVYAVELSGKALVLERLAKEGDPDWVQMNEALQILKSGFATLKAYLGSHS